MLQLNWSSESRQANLSAGNISAKLEVEEDVAFAKPSEYSYTIQWFGPTTVVTCCCPQVEFKSAIFQSRVYASNRVIPEPSCSTGAKSSLFWLSDAFGLANARLQCRSSAAKSEAAEESSTGPELNQLTETAQCFAARPMLTKNLQSPSGHACAFFLEVCRCLCGLDLQVSGLGLHSRIVMAVVATLVDVGVGFGMAFGIGIVVTSYPWHRCRGSGRRRWRHLQSFSHVLVVIINRGICNSSSIALMFSHPASLCMLRVMIHHRHAQQ